MQNFQATIIGSLEIHREGFFKHPELRRHIEQPEEVIKALEATGVDQWTRRLFTFALATTDENSVGLMLLGLNPDTEPRVTSIADKVTEGRFLKRDDAYGCVLGATTARMLGVGLGDPIVFMTYDRYGVPTAEEFTLTGIITSGEMGIDRGMALASLATVQDMLDMQGRITSITVRLPPPKLEAITAGLREQLAGQGYEVMRWYDMYPMVMEWMSLSDGFHYVFLGVVLLIVLAGVLNTMLLSMLERTRELGMLMALGMKRYQIGELVSLESLVIGLMGTAAGTLLGVVAVWIVREVGIDLSILLGSTTRFYVDPVIRTQLNTDHLLFSSMAALATTLLAGVYPALKAATLEPVAAIRHG